MCGLKTDKSPKIVFSDSLLGPFSDYGAHSQGSREIVYGLISDSFGVLGPEGPEHSAWGQGEIVAA